MKKIKLSIIFLLIALCSLSLFACGGAIDGEIEEIKTTAKPLTVAVKEYDLIVGDEEIIFADYETSEDKTLGFSSLDPSVAKVNENGIVDAVGVGETTVKVSYGEEEVSVSIKVGLGDLVPTLSLKHISQENLTVTVGDKLEVSPVIMFNGKEFSPEEITFSKTDENVATITDGVICPIGKGDIEVTLSCKWQGREFSTLTKILKISVINKIELLINGESDFSDRVLYTLNSFDGKDFDTTAPFSIKGYINDEEVTPKVTVSDVDLLDYSSENNKISVSELKKSGTVVLTIELTGDNETYTKNINVIIKPCFGTYRGEAILFSLVDGDLPTGNIFGEETVILSAEDSDGNKIEVTDGKITGLSVEKENLGKEIKIRVYATGCGYEIAIKPYTKVIRTAEDLAIFELKDVTKVQGTSIKSTTLFDGYYVVANDIDAKGYTHQAVKDATANSTLNSTVDSEGNPQFDNNKRDVGDNSYYYKGAVSSIEDMPIYGGLTGTFDGAGHTISDLTVRDQGLFGLMTNGTVKNIAFNNVTLEGSGYKKNVCLFAQNVLAGTFENVYVKANPVYGGEWHNHKDAASDARGNRALVAIQVGGYYDSIVGNKNGWKTTNFTNCVFEYEIKNTTAPYCFSYGLYAMESGYNGGEDAEISPNFNNVYVISNTTLSVYNLSLVVKNNTKVIMAENEAGEELIDAVAGILNGWNDKDIEGVKSVLGANLFKIVEGVKRYANGEAMNAAGNDYASFSSDYWSVSDDGVLSWKK